MQHDLESPLQAPEPQETALDRAIKLAGSMSAIAREVGVTPKAVRKWKLARALPRTEYTGETSYSQTIERLTRGAVSRDELLAMRRHRHGDGA